MFTFITGEMLASSCLSRKEVYVYTKEVVAQLLSF